jgi:hypothetical protein
MKPCSASRDDGNHTEPDESDRESDQDEAESAPDSTLVVATNFDEGSSQIPAGRVQSETEAPIDPTNGESSRVSSDVSTIAEQQPQSTAAQNDDQSTSGAAELPVIDQEAFRNLDDPDNPEHDWEAEDFDFGEEPADEYWDVWGCMHRFKAFTAEQIPDRWLTNLDISKPMTIECMACFQTINIEAKKATETKAKTVEEWVNEKQKKVVLELDTDAEADSKVARKEKRKSNKTSAYECKECGVVHCWWCRRTALRRLTNYRKGAPE